MNIGIDFGSSSTMITEQGKGIILDEPSVIALDAETKYPIAFGNNAYTIDGRTDERIEVIHPVLGGVISDYTNARKLLTYYMQKVLGNKVFKPNVIITVPSGATGLDRRTLLDVAISSGAGKVCLIEESLASAVGAGISEKSMSGRMLVNLGGGSVDISVITMGNIAVSNTVRVGGIDLDNAILKYLQRSRDIYIGPLTAERLKICLGSAVKRKEEIALVTFGKSGLDNMPISFEITSTEVFNCIEEQLELMINGIKSVLEKTPPELIGDISDNGIMLTGGTALLFGMEKRIAEETGIEVKTVKDPLYNTMNGVNSILEHFDMLTEGYSFRNIHQIN